MTSRYRNIGARMGLLVIVSSSLQTLARLPWATSLLKWFWCRKLLLNRLQMRPLQLCVVNCGYNQSPSFNLHPLQSIWSIQSNAWRKDRMLSGVTITVRVWYTMELPALFLCIMIVLLNTYESGAITSNRDKWVSDQIVFPFHNCINRHWLLIESRWRDSVVVERPPRRYVDSRPGSKTDL